MVLIAPVVFGRATDSISSSGSRSNVQKLWFRRLAVSRLQILQNEKCYAGFCIKPHSELRTAYTLQNAVGDIHLMQNLQAQVSPALLHDCLSSQSNIAWGCTAVAVLAVAVAVAVTVAVSGGGSRSRSRSRNRAEVVVVVSMAVNIWKHAFKVAIAPTSSAIVAVFIGEGSMATFRVLCLADRRTHSSSHGSEWLLPQRGCV